MIAKVQSKRKPPLVGIIMGSTSDWETMTHVAQTLDRLGIPHETRVVSAHRTPDLLFAYASEAEKRGIEVIVAGAGGAAHLPGMTAAKTVLPVFGVPVESKTLKGLDSLLSIAQMPGASPGATTPCAKKEKASDDRDSGRRAAGLHARARRLPARFSLSFSGP